jgi:hypothetical protein
MSKVKELEYTFEKTSGGAYRVSLCGEFICYIHNQDSNEVDEVLKNAGFTSKEDFLNFALGHADSASDNSIIQINNKFFVPTGDGLKEIPFAAINAWYEEGMKIEIKEVESFV